MNPGRWLPVLLLLGGCTAWGGTLTVEGLPSDPPPSRVFQIWHQDTLHELHGLRVDADTVRGVPSSQDRSCATCTIAIARADVDSVRVREFKSGATALAVGATIWVLLRTGVLAEAFVWLLGG